MAVSPDQFWKLAAASGLLSQQQCQELNREFLGLKGAASQTGAVTLSKWLIARGTLSRYQASVLLSGRPGPFVFGDFVIRERIEKGRLARAFRATYKQARPALLVFAPASRDDPRQARITVDRFETARAINSPHVLHVYQYQSAASPPFFVLEDLQGQSLREWLVERKPTVDQACHIGFQAALGLVAMHEAGTVHGNLTPNNVWIDSSLSVKLLQYPLVGSLPPQERFRRVTVDYLAPELADTACKADVRTDIYSLGCILYELIAGEAPFANGNVEQTVERQANETPKRLDNLVASVTEEVGDLVEEMLYKEPLMRAQTASHVAHLLAPYSTGVRERFKQRPPHEGPQQIAPGYGAWKEPGWQSPPQPSNLPKAIPVDKEGSSATEIANPDRSGVPRIVIDRESREPGASPHRSRAPKRRMSRTTMVGVAAGLLVVALVALAGIILLRRGAVEQPKRPVASQVTPSNSGTAPSEEVVPPNGATGNEHSGDGAGASTPPAKGNVDEIDDDGKTLWVSPTAGQPLSLRYLPSSTQLILALRPADILASDEGRRLLEALGPAGQSVAAHLRNTLGVELADIEQLIVAFVPDDAGAPQPAYMMRLESAVPEETLLRAWDGPQPAVHNERSFFQGPSLAYYLPPDEQGRVVAIAAPPVMKEILSRDGGPLLRKGIEDLLRTSDDQRHFNLLAAPSYLLTDGRTLMLSDLAKLHGPLEQFFDMNVQAVLASGYVGEELFLELRVVGPADRPPQKIADVLRSRLDTFSQQLEAYVASLSPHPYGRLVVIRFPRMVQLASDFTRAAADGRQAVLRCYLPASAAHNLLLGAELVLFEEPGLAAPSATQPVARRPRSAAAALDQIVTLSFPRDTLERSLELLGEEIDVPIVIVGTDLQLEGITKNQSFGLDEHNKSARDILRKVLALANPDGKLVYVFRPGKDASEEIYITTRAAAAKRKEPLPEGQDQKTPAKTS